MLDRLKNEVQNYNDINSVFKNNALSLQPSLPLAIVFVKNGANVTHSEMTDCFHTNNVNISKPLQGNFHGIGLVSLLADLLTMIGNDVEIVAYAINADLHGDGFAELNNKYDDLFFFANTEQIELFYRLYMAYEMYERGAPIASEIKQNWIYAWQQVMSDLMKSGYTSDNFDSDISALDVINEKKDNFGKALVQLLSQLRPR